MKLVIIGSNGQLGTELCRQYSGKASVTGLTHADLEIADPVSVSEAIGRYGPDVVINTAAYHNVPKCEEYPVEAMKINGLGALNLAKVCADSGSALVHISTDYVFDGVKGEPYVESDPPNPLNVYAASKLAGEYFVRNYIERFYILRVSGIYGSTPCRAKGGNFITTMIRAAKERDVVRVVDDEVLTPTPVSDIAANLWSLIQGEAYGHYHMTAEGKCSWYEFAEVIFDELKLGTPLEACRVRDFPMTVKRPTYSVLENHNLKSAGLNQMHHWRESLIKFLSENYQ
jgi:dTDP-4-dehydrorhamnose reductase